MEGARQLIFIFSFKYRMGVEWTKTIWTGSGARGRCDGKRLVLSPDLEIIYIFLSHFPKCSLK